MDVAKKRNFIKRKQMQFKFRKMQTMELFQKFLRLFEISALFDTFFLSLKSGNSAIFAFFNSAF